MMDIKHWILLLAVVGAACATKDEKVSDDSKEIATKHKARKASAPDDTAAAVAEEVEEAYGDESGFGGKLEDAVVDPEEPMPINAPAPAMRKKLGGTRGEPEKGGGGAAEQGPAPRAWFPETFLFQPRVITDDSGRAQVKVRVPDRLTNWHVLALAHSRGGSQAGSTTSFQGTLEAYVDPVVPSRLRSGDQVRIPIQLVNNTEQALQTTLTLEVDGGTLSKPNGGSITIDKQSSKVSYATLTVPQAGEVRLMARMGDSDMVVRTIEVIPTGKPVSQTKNGTLAQARKFSLPAGTQLGQVRLSVFPGALALLRSELSASLHRDGLASSAFAMLLAGKAPQLLRSLGEEPDPEALRKLTIISTQKVIKQARVLDSTTATLLAEAAAAHPGNPVLERLGLRAVSTIESAQAPDGTCGGESGWTLQRLLVSTADCARAAHSSPKVTIRAAGAFERHGKEIADPYTAAAILAAKAATGDFKTALEKLVLEAIVAKESGAKVLSVPGNVVRADGARPSVVEATALAVLALADVADAPLPDLGATILANYSPGYGWGDGRANLVCMEAAIKLFKDPIPDKVKIELRKDGELVAEGDLERQKVRELLTLGADGVEIGGNWQVSAEPAVPGLGFSLTATRWVPWQKEDGMGGGELRIEMPTQMQVGKAVLLPVDALAPSNTPFEIALALPAGAQVDIPALDAQVNQGSLLRYKKTDGHLTLFVAGLPAGERYSQAVRIIPTLGGSLQSGPATITVHGISSNLPPSTWVIR